VTNSKTSESVFESLFRQAVIDNFDEQLDSITQKFESSEPSAFSLEHEKRMMLLFAKENRKDKLHKTIKWSKRIAAIIILTISLLFGSLMFVTEVRAAVIGIVVEWFDQFTRFTSNAPVTEKKNHEPTFIPNGFWESLHDSNDFITVILYENNEGLSILFDTHLASAQLSVDSEDHIYETKEINNIFYHILTTSAKGKANKIIWEIDGQRYLLASELSIEELFEMAFSVR